MTDDRWFLITGWNDDQGRRKSRAELWADSTRFSPEELLAAPEDKKAKVLSHIYTLDLPPGSATERIQHLIATDRERLINGVLLSLVPSQPGDSRWVDHQAAKTRERPADSDMTLVISTFGVSVYRLTTPIDIPDREER